jgi:hypothetical protein
VSGGCEKEKRPARKKREFIITCRIKPIKKSLPYITKQKRVVLEHDVYCLDSGDSNIGQTDNKILPRIALSNVKPCDLCTVMAKASTMRNMIRSHFAPFQLLVTRFIGTGWPSSFRNRQGSEYVELGTDKRYSGKSL